MQVLALIITFIVVSADQLLKCYVVSNLQLGQVQPIITHFLSLTYVQNEGAAWNILPGQMGLFYVISLVAIIVCLYYLFKNHDQSKLFNLGIALVLGGIIGNLVDRIHLKYVIDMIQLDFINFNIFNIADSAITVGIICVFIYLLFFDKDDEDQHAN